MSEMLEQWVAELLSTDDDIRKKAASELANADLTLLSPDMVHNLNENLVQVSGDQNLTIRYFARKLKKRMSESGILAEAPAEPSPPPAPEPDLPTPAVSKPEPVPAHDTLCPSCGASMPPSYSFCGMCGVCIEPPKVSQPPKEAAAKEPVQTAPISAPIAAASASSAVSSSAKKPNIFVKILSVLLVLSFNAFFVETLRVRFLEFTQGPDASGEVFIGLPLNDILAVVTSDHVFPVILGVMFIELLLITFFRKAVTANGLFKFSLLAFLSVVWLSLISAGPNGDTGIPAFNLDRDIWSYSSLLLVVFFLIAFVWRNGSKKALLKMSLSALGIYAMVPLVLALFDAVPFTMDLYAYDASFFQDWFSLPYIKPLYLCINVLLPILFLYGICVLLAAPFKSGKKAFLGAVFSVLIIGMPMLIGQHLYARSPGMDGHTLHSLIEDYAQLKLPERGCFTGSTEVTASGETGGEAAPIPEPAPEPAAPGERKTESEAGGGFIVFSTTAEVIVKGIVLANSDRLRTVPAKELPEVETELAGGIAEKVADKLDRELTADEERIIAEELKQAVEDLRFMAPPEDREEETLPQTGETVETTAE